MMPDRGLCHDHRGYGLLLYPDICQMLVHAMPAPGMAMHGDEGSGDFSTPG